jgi:hypothetical protein
LSVVQNRDEQYRQRVTIVQAQLFVGEQSIE